MGEVSDEIRVDARARGGARLWECGRDVHMPQLMDALGPKDSKGYEHELTSNGTPGNDAYATTIVPAMLSTTQT